MGAIIYGNVSPMQGNRNDENKTWWKLYWQLLKETWPLLEKGWAKWPVRISIILSLLQLILELSIGQTPMIREWVNTFPLWLWGIAVLVLGIVSFFQANYKKHRKSYSTIHELRTELNSIEKACPEFTFDLSDVEQHTKLPRMGKEVRARWYRIEVTNLSPSIMAKRCSICTVDINPRPVNFARGPLPVTNETLRETDISPGATKSFGLVWLRLDRVRPERQAFIPVHPEIPLMSHKEYTVTLRFTGSNFSWASGIYAIKCNDNSLSVDDSKEFGAVPNNDTH